MLIFINIKLQPDTCSHSSVCRLTSRSYTDFNNKISNKNYIALIYPSKLSIYTLFTLGSD